MTGIQPQKLVSRWAIAAVAWCLAFGALSAAWAAGSMFGVSKLAPTLQEEAASRSNGFVLLLWITSALKVFAAFLPLSAAHPSMPSLVHRLARIGCWCLGVGFSLYGLADTVTGAIRAGNGEGHNAFWYAVLWGPIWLVGGITFLGVAWHSRRD